MSSLGELERFAYCGHRQVLGYGSQAWIAVEEILSRFGQRQSTARNAYASFVAEGVEQGKRTDLTGGGLVRSTGGWQHIQSAKQAGVSPKGDERILGDSDFVETVLSTACEQLECRGRYRRQGIDLESLVKIVADVMGMDAREILKGGKQPHRVKAPSLLCFWAIRDLGMTATSLAGTLSLTQPAVSTVVQRGERLASENGWKPDDLTGLNI